jgi:hypothetical protein
MKKTSIVVDGVTYHAEQPELKKAKIAIEKFEWIKISIENQLAAAQNLYDNMREEGLNFGSIEAEGFLRAMKTLSSEIKMIEDTLQ